MRFFEKILAICLLPGVMQSNASAQAVPNATQKPGLWEISSTLQAEAGSDYAKFFTDMAERTAKLPEQQRKELESQEKDIGFSIVPFGVSNMKVCLTQALLDSPATLAAAGANCTPQMQDPPVSGTKFSFICSNPTFSGEGEFSYVGDDGFAAKMHMVVDYRGKPQKATISTSMRFLSSDCGNVKPLALRKG